MSGFYFTDAAELLRAAGLEVEEVGNWKTRTATGSGYVDMRGILWHHDASPPGDSPGALQWMLTQGPAANCWVDRYGKWFIYCGGVSYHAGTGGPGWNIPKDMGNQFLWGVETDHTTGEKWPEAQLSSLRKGTAALLLGLKLDPKFNGGLLFHYSWTNGGIDGLPKFATYGRKNDPDGLDLAAERAVVSGIMRDLGTNPKTAAKIRELQRRLERTRLKAQAARYRGESTAGFPSRIRRLKDRIKRLVTGG
jgi:hypothetical protein